MLTREAIAVLKGLNVVDLRVARLERLKNELDSLQLAVARGNVGPEVQLRCVRCATELLQLRSTLFDANGALITSENET